MIRVLHTYSTRTISRNIIPIRTIHSSLGRRLPSNQLWRNYSSQSCPTKKQNCLFFLGVGAAFIAWGSSYYKHTKDVMRFNSNLNRCKENIKEGAFDKITFDDLAQFRTTDIEKMLIKQLGKYITDLSDCYDLNSYEHIITTFEKTISLCHGDGWRKVSFDEINPDEVIVNDYLKSNHFKYLLEIRSYNRDKDFRAYCYRFFRSSESRINAIRYFYNQTGDITFLNYIEDPADIYRLLKEFNITGPKLSNFMSQFKSKLVVSKWKDPDPDLKNINSNWHFANSSDISTDSYYVINQIHRIPPQHTEVEYKALLELLHQNRPILI